MPSLMKREQAWVSAVHDWGPPWILWSCNAACFDRLTLQACAAANVVLST